MKFTLAWLKDHLDTQASLAAICDTLTAIGLEVESVTDTGAVLAPFTVAHILQAEQHPQADKLRVCTVQSDAGELQIVCGAANARAGIKVALAKEGAVIPANGMKIKKSAIRGVESQGMLCSAEELGLAQSSEGILELPDTARVGGSVAHTLGLDDPVIEIALTPNRADCLGVRGVARDLAAAGLGTLKPLRSPAPLGVKPPPIAVTISTPHCRQFIGCHIQGVKNGQSPEWMRRRLTAIGQRPISALVDITNYFTFDLARPLHVFDAAKLTGGLIVRSAREGEMLQALDGKNHALRPGMTVIADGAGAQAIGGIIGGTAAAVSDDTSDVFLEVALFDPVNIAQTGRALSILSDARYRFERSVDPAFAETGAALAAHMIQELCGGTASALVIAGAPQARTSTISFRASRVESLGGVAVESDRIVTILEALGFRLEELNGSAWNVIPPSWRADVEGEADVVEEVLRIIGYAEIPATPLPKPVGITKPALTVAQKRASLARRLLATRGLLEVCGWSFIAHAQAELFGGAKPELALLNPISAELAVMRPNLFPNLLSAARNNAYRGLRDTGFFEVGLQFSGTSLDSQALVAAGLRTGGARENTYPENRFCACTRDVDAFDAKADAFAVVQTLGLNPAKIEIIPRAPAWYHPGRSGLLTLGGKMTLGAFGELHPAVLQAFELESRVAGFEIFLNALPSSRGAGGKARRVLERSDYQSVERDFAFVVDENVTAAALSKALAQADRNLVTAIELFDVYRGKGLPEGRKSMAVKVTLQAPDRTLTETEIHAVSQKLVDAVTGALGANLRQQ